MEFEAVAQHEAVVKLVWRYVELADHLRVRLELRVNREQRVGHHIAVIAGPIGRRPDRVEHLDVGWWNEAQCLLVRGGGPYRPRQHRGAERGGGRRLPELAAGQIGHAASRTPVVIAVA